MSRWFSIAVVIPLLAASLATIAAPPAPHGWLKQVTFNEASPLASNVELMRRLVSPLRVAQFERDHADAARILAGQPLAPADQRFALFVPTAPPPAATGCWYSYRRGTARACLRTGFRCWSGPARSW